MDEGHKLTDIELERVERRCMRMYRQAEKEMSGVIRNYFSEFEVLDKERKGWVEAGKMTAAEYQSWRLARMARGERFVSMRNDLARRLTNSHSAALELINNAMPKVYTLNRNWSAYEIEKGSGIAFNIYDETTVRDLLVNNPDIMPEYNPYFPKSMGLQTPKDLIYGKQVITNEITSGILQGKSIDGIADSIQHRISTMNRTQAVRAARTAMTAAQNGGRMATYQEAEKMGIKLKKQWMATLDARTRDSHAKLDGETVATDKKFSNGCRYPADPEGRPAEVYNCRCTMIAEIEDSPYSKTYTAPDGKTAEYRSFKEWQAGKLASGNIAVVNTASVGYNNISAIQASKPTTAKRTLSLVNPYSGELEDVELSDAFDNAKMRQKLSEEFIKEADNALERTNDPNVIKLFQMFKDDYQMGRTDYNGAHYSPLKNWVEFNSSVVKNGTPDGYKLPFQNMLHEFAHFVDHNASEVSTLAATWENGKLFSSIRKDALDFEEKAKVSSNWAYARSLLGDFSSHDIGGVSDSLEAFTESYPLGGGHGSKYWGTGEEKQYRVTTEFFAHCCESYLAGDKYQNALKTVFPTAWEDFQKMIYEVTH